MKKLIYLLLWAFIFTACSDEPAQPNVATDATLSAQVSNPQLRSLDEVVEIANYASTRFGKSKSRATNQADLEISCIKSAASSRAEGDTLLYVVNYQDNNGFAIISAKNDHEGLLAYSENGTYVPGKEFDNPGMNMMMNNAIAYATSPGNILIPPTLPENPKMMEWVEDTTAIDVAPRLNVAWGTDYLGEYGLPDPNVTCGPIAVAQALSYIKQPTSIVLTHKDNTTIPLDWDYMISDANLMNNQRNSLGREIAFRMGAFTSINHSTMFADCKNVIDELCPGHTGEIQQSLPNISNINYGGIFLVRGSYSQENKEDGSNGHAFIIDGGHYLLITETTYVVTYVSGTHFEISRELKGTKTIREENFFHVNWGWSGINNGYFNVQLLSPANGIEYDSNRTSTSADFSNCYKYNQYYIRIF